MTATPPVPTPTLITLAQLKAIMPLAGKRAEAYLGPVNHAAARWEITTPARLALWLAHVAVESGEFKYTEELASGAAYDTGRLAVKLGNTPAADGDGQFFKGHGPMEITGHDNHRDCSRALYGDDRLLKNPRLLCQPEDGMQSAGWFWWSKGLNAVADRGDFPASQLLVNGGHNGESERRAYWARAKRVLGVR